MAITEGIDGQPSTGVLGDLDTIIGRVIIRYQKEENEA
jgi:hypothetical protein